MAEAALRRNGQDGIAGNLDTSFLKVLALVFMLTDHLGVVIFPGIPEMRMIGRMAFPIYAWCLVVGSVKTHDPIRYGLRLLALAVVSQPLYLLALNHTWTDLSILFTLLLALIALQGIRARFAGSHIWMPLLCYVVLGYLKMDYGWRGLTFILLLYMARGSRAGLAATFMAYALFWGAASSQVTSVFGLELSFLSWNGVGVVLASLFRLQGMIWLALPLILLPTHTKLRMPKWLGYGLYPMHLVLLIALRLLMGTPLATLTKGF